MDYSYLYFLLLFQFLLGLSVGSFLNVVIFRIPKSISIVKPRSFCPECSCRIKWYDLIPILSWILLRGKCRNCSENISLRYPAIEFFTASLFLISGFISYQKYSESMILAFSIFASSILIAFILSISLIDIDHFIIPNRIVIPGIFIGILLTLIFQLNFETLNNIILEHWFSSLFGLVFFTTFSYLGEKLFKKPILGFGDAMLFAFSGAWLGLAGLELVGILTILIAGSFGLVGLLSKKLKRGQYIPFAPFICTSIYLVWIFGDSFWIDSLGNLLWWRYAF